MCIMIAYGVALNEWVSKVKTWLSIYARLFPVTCLGALQHCEDASPTT
jgi:hypothetical protein